MSDVVDAKSTNRGSAWSVETNPKYARAWIESLSPLSNLDSTRELHQGLCALNRVELDPGKRYELLQLYQAPVQEACESLQSAFLRVSFPMPAKLRRLAGFVCQLHMEMARGYMTCLLGLAKSWLMPWRRQTLVLPAERALYHLSEVLLRSYHLYLPYPAEVWRNAHAAYRLVERHGRGNDQVDASDGKEPVRISVSQRYRRLLLLGVANPYQMPFGECLTAYRFLGRWIDQVTISANAPDGTGFLVDLTADTPPAGLGRAPTATPAVSIRWLDISELTRTLHVMLRRLEKGEGASTLQLGIDCLDSACHDMLQRLHRVFAQTTTRRHSRIKRHETIMICAGIGALHFFAGGQKPFGSSGPLTPTEEPYLFDIKEGEAYVPLDEPANTTSMPRTPGSENFRVDRWHVHDVCPQGLMISQEKEASVRFRVGDLLGIQRVSTPGQWSVGLVRWCKAQGESGIEVGIELIAPDVTPASVTPVATGETARPALILPAVEATGRQASVVVASGTMQVGSDCFLADARNPTRRVRILDAIERTGSIEQVTVGNVV
jgi:cyclic-di-GMP-binding protein